MNWKSPLHDYFTNPFILLELFLVALWLLSFIPFVDHFRTTLWANLGYLVILFPIAILAVFYDVMIIKNNGEFHTAIRNNRKRRLILLGIMIILLTELEAVYFMIDIIKIIGEQFPKSIIDNTVYDQQMFIVGVSIYGIIPIIHYYSSWTIKKWYGVKSNVDHNRFKIDILPVIPYLCLIFIGSLIGISVYNCETGLLKPIC